MTNHTISGHQEKELGLWLDLIDLLEQFQKLPNKEESSIQIANFSPEWTPGVPFEFTLTGPFGENDATASVSFTFNPLTLRVMWKNGQPEWHQTLVYTSCQRLANITTILSAEIARLNPKK